MAAAAGVLTKLVNDDPRRIKLTVSGGVRFAISPDPAWDPATQPGLENSFSARGLSYMHFCRCEWGEIVRRSWNVHSASAVTYFVIEELEGGAS